jgi:hypothetical protein
MRDYRNSDTSSFNTYRSGTENPRRELSSRTETGSPASVVRPGSNLGTADHYQENSLWHQPNDYRDHSQNRNNQRYNSSANDNQRWDQNSQDRNQSNNWSSDRNNQSGSWQNNHNNWQSNQQHTNRWDTDHRQHQSNYGNHSQDRDYDRHRSGDRDFFERTGDKISQSWNRLTNDDDNDRYQNNRYDQNRSGYSADRNQQRYSSDYGYQNRANQGRGYDTYRYNNRSYNDDYRRNNHEDEGFFDKVGNYISNAWNNLTQEEREDQNRANRYRNDHNRWDDSDNRSGHSRTSSNSGPPYNYGSSSRRDYEW